LGREAFKDLMAAQALDPAMGGDEELETAFELAVHHALFVLRDREGRTLAGRWEGRGWDGLTNDERVMMRYRRHAFPTIIEVQRVLSDHSLECIDVLEEEGRPFVVFDRNTAGRAVRFDQFLVWICHYPHYTRVGPSGVGIPRSIASEFLEELRRQALETGASTPKDYLLSHYPEGCRLVTEVTQAQFHSVLASTDIHQCTTTYALTAGRDAVAAVLDEKPDFDRDDRDLAEGDPPGTDYYVWLQRGESRALGDEPREGLAFDSYLDGVATVGNVKLLPDRLVIETSALRKHRFAKRMVESYFGDLVALRDEKTVDVAKQAADRVKAEGLEATDADPAEDDDRSVPLEVEQELVGRLYRDHYARFLDDPMPMLDGMTPRGAARDPAMRPRLVELMKGHVHQVEEVSRRKGVRLRIDWVLEELGLSELL
jgi:hypothetical protein